MRPRYAKFNIVEKRLPFCILFHHKTSDESDAIISVYSVTDDIGQDMASQFSENEDSSGEDIPNLSTSVSSHDENNVKLETIEKVINQPKVNINWVVDGGARSLDEVQDILAKENWWKKSDNTLHKKEGKYIIAAIKLRREGRSVRRNYRYFMPAIR